MKAKFVFENIKFERGRDPKESMEIGHYGIKRALLDQQPIKADTLLGDATRNWWEGGGIPLQFKEEIGYDESDPLAFMDFVGFDEDWYMENELPGWEDTDKFLKEFTPSGPKKNIPNTRGWGLFQYQRGKLPDGTIVYHFRDGNSSGFMTRREWLKE